MGCSLLTHSTKNVSIGNSLTLLALTGMSAAIFSEEGE